MMFVSFNSNTTGDTCGAGTVNPFDGFSGSRVAQSLVLCSVLYSSMFILLSFFFWPFYCLYFFGLRFLTTPLVSPNFYSVFLRFTVSDYPFGIPRLLFRMSSVYGFWLPLWYPQTFIPQVSLQTALCLCVCQVLHGNLFKKH